MNFHEVQAYWDERRADNEKFWEESNAKYIEWRRNFDSECDKDRWRAFWTVAACYIGGFLFAMLVALVLLRSLPAPQRQPQQPTVIYVQQPAGK